MSKRLLCATAAGLAGAFAMHAFRAAWRSLTGGCPEMDVFGLDRESDINSMQLLARVFLCKNIDDATAEQLAILFHYGYGAAAGVVYGALSSRVPMLRSGFGTLYGAGIWILGDEIPISMAGLTDLKNKAAASHAAALLAHLIFGAAAELVFRSASAVTAR